MATYIRLTDYRDSDSKEQGFFKSENRYEGKQSDFEKIPGSPIAYWVSDRVKEIFFNNNLISNISPTRDGITTGDNDLFIRLWHEVEYKLGLNFKNRNEAQKSGLKWFPYSKGGEFRKWFGNIEYVVNWLNDGEDLIKFPKSYPRNKNFYFNKGITWTLLSTGNSFGVRQLPYGTIFDVNSKCSFPENKENLEFVLGFLSTKIAYKLLIMINPTMAFQAGDIAKLPIIFPKQDSIKQTIDILTQQNIDISKEEWDSRETSWDFTKNELLRFLGSEALASQELGGTKVPLPKLEEIYCRYCEYWREKFYQLHKNEEELNRLFIDIYELQDELTPDVALKDITILKSESIINDNNELEFKADEIMKQFISYAVGVMFGRYSLDSDGLVVANLGSDALVSQMSDETKVSFPIDDDNVIPVLEDDYFSDDIASRVVSFVKTTFGAENLSENIAFIEKCLGKTIRAYMVKDFYEDHIKRYKKRPIYWMVSSPKKGFMSLSYMHRYQSDLFARVQNNYLREYITKLEGTLTNQEHIANDSSNSPTQRAKAAKEIDRINKKIEELIKFDRESITKFAQNRIELDLDDGVKANYLKFMEILYPIKGME